MVSNKKRLLITLSLLVILIVLFFPIRVPCKVPVYTCAPPPDVNGKYSITVEVEPAAVYILELFTQTNFPFSYYSYEDVKTIKSTYTQN